VQFIIAAPDEATRSALRAALNAAGLIAGAEVESPSQLQLPERRQPDPLAGSEAIIVTGPSLRHAQEFVHSGLDSGFPVLIWPTAKLPLGSRSQPRGVRLTARERQILSLVAAGVSNKGIAAKLAVSPNTVKFHLSALFAKLHVTRRAEAIAAAARSGELSL
jgi:ATP/maltotriose-dependent transcriptional regulator MalT